MNQLPIGVGDALAQQRFIRSHKEFLLEHLTLHALLEKVSLRTLAVPHRRKWTACCSFPTMIPPSSH